MAARYGVLDQPPKDDLTVAALMRGEIGQAAGADGVVRYVFPLKAEARCLSCHGNAQVGDVLGAIDVRQDMAGSLGSARDEFLRTMLWLAPLPFLAAFLVVWRLNVRISRSVGALRGRVEEIVIPSGKSSSLCGS